MLSQLLLRINWYVGEPEETLNKLSGLVRIKKDHVEGIADMRMLLRYLTTFQIPRERLVFDVSLVHMFPLYSGVVFQAVLPQGDIIALGGRYDELICRFSPPNSISSEPVAAVGINFGQAKIASYYNAFERVKSSCITISLNYTSPCRKAPRRRGCACLYVIPLFTSVQWGDQ